jgi:hypothetical protein
MVTRRRSLLILLILVSGGVALAVEEPKYDLLMKYDDFEVRRYPTILVAETEVTGNFTEVGNQAFRILVAFIGGDNSKKSEIAMTAPVIQSPAVSGKGEEIAMTAPVLQESAQTDGANSYLLAFVMPPEYTLENLPVPRDPRVHIRQIPERTMAVRRYSGSWDEKKYDDQEKLLMEAVRKKGFMPTGNPVFARYNPPFMPSFLRRNEVLIELVKWETPIEKGSE